MKLERKLVVGPVENWWSDESLFQNIHALLTFFVPSHETISISTAFIRKGSLLMLPKVRIIFKIIIVVVRVLSTRVLRR